ncbi:MAG: hypothetical protein ACM3TR_19960 [Caulobacteraceae bacterium]
MKMKKELVDEQALLTTGFEFILSALSHLKEETDHFALKVVLIHLTVGIELVLKERLRRDHWTLVVDRLSDVTIDRYKTGDFRSADFGACISRLEEICEVDLNEEKNILKELRAKRNLLEHFGQIGSIEAVRALTVKALSLTFDFISRELETNLNEEQIELRHEIRVALKEVKDLVDERFNKIQEEFKDQKQLFETCPTCHMRAAIFKDDDNEDYGIWCCKFCNDELISYDMAENYVSNILEDSCDNIVECPSCGEETLVIDHSKREFESLCFNCLCGWSIKDLVRCDQCGSIFDSKASDGLSICDSCFEGIINDDRK